MRKSISTSKKKGKTLFEWLLGTVNFERSGFTAKGEYVMAVAINIIISSMMTNFMREETCQCAIAELGYSGNGLG